MERMVLKPDEAGQALGIGRSKAQRMIATGELPSIQVGRARRVPVEALRAWIAQRVEGAGGSQEEVGNE